MRRTLTLVIALSWLLNGCTSWQTEEVAPASYIGSQHPGKVRLTMHDSTQLVLQAPSVVGDSINGWAKEKVGKTDSLRLRAVAAAEVDSLEVRHTDVVASIFLGVGIAAVGAAAVIGGLLIACFSGGGCSN